MTYSSTVDWTTAVSLSTGNRAQADHMPRLVLLEVWEKWRDPRFAPKRVSWSKKEALFAKSSARPSKRLWRENSRRTTNWVYQEEQDAIQSSTNGIERFKKALRTRWIIPRTLVWNMTSISCSFLSRNGIVIVGYSELSEHPTTAEEEW
jgi:hypothetical protein